MHFKRDIILSAIGALIIMLAIIFSTNTNSEGEESLPQVEQFTSVQ
jgi:hypothetical protein